MELQVAVAVLVAALLHAAWHGLVKSSGDQVTALAGMNLVSGAVALASIPFVRAPSGPVAAIIALSVLMHVGYKVALARLYQRADLSVAYPLARGLTPVLATLLGLTAIGERPSPWQLLGVLSISVGISCLLLDRARRPTWTTLLLASAVGLAVAVYSVIDAYGVRLNADWFGFTAWLVASDSLVFVGYALATRGSRAMLAWRSGWGRTLVSGLLGTASFGVFIWALSRAPVGPVSALRESSIIFASLIGMFFLREQVTIARVIAALLVVAGAAAIALAR
jgi:drug/metabolite transporter (DMT)-like permease